MRRKAITVTVMFAGMLFISVASAEPCANGVCLTRQANVVQNITPAVVTTQAVVQAATVLPIYGAAYQPQYQAAGDDETKAILRQLLEEMKAMRAELATKGQTPGSPSALNVGPAPIDPVVLLKANCAKCHTGSTAKGDFLIYTDKGESVKLSPADRREMTKRINSGNMPPPPAKQLTAGEKEALARGLK